MEGDAGWQKADHDELVKIRKALVRIADALEAMKDQKTYVRIGDVKWLEAAGVAPDRSEMTPPAYRWVGGRWEENAEGEE